MRRAARPGTPSRSPALLELAAPPVDAIGAKLMQIPKPDLASFLDATFESAEMAAAGYVSEGRRRLQAACWEAQAAAVGSAWLHQLPSGARAARVFGHSGLAAGQTP